MLEFEHCRKRTQWAWVLYIVVSVSNLYIVLPSPQPQQSATEILYIENGYPEHRNYKLEDFFWTGSGDGSPNAPWEESIKSSTIYKTKTVMSTVYISISNDNQSNTQTESPPGSECTLDCETVTLPDGTIKPTPAFENYTVTPPVFDSNATTDKHFWLLTVIKTNDKEPIITVLEKRLSKLYSVAFRRQQERHLGIQKRQKRQLPTTKYPAENKPVNVCIHTLAKNEDTKEVEVLYHVLVSGKPVAAITAASDMRLVTDEEAAIELGFPVRTKAEPFLKVERPQSLARTRDTWLFIGVAFATIFLLLLMVTIFTLCLNKRKKSMIPTRPIGIINRQQVFEREENHRQSRGDPTKTYQSGRRQHRKSPSRPRYSTSNETLTSRCPAGRPTSSQSSTSTSSTSSNTPDVIASKHRSTHSRKKHRHSEKRPAAINKALLQKQGTIILDTDSSIDIDNYGSEITLVKDVKNRDKISPKSYLSIPSIKSFPRSNIPETLNKVLEPVSVLHLDMTDDVIPESNPIYRPMSSSKRFSRHGSLGSQDPGVIGPVVWDLHCKRLQNDSEDDNEPKSENHANRMRRRFHELLDDTFSLFGNSKESQIEPSKPVSGTTPKQLEIRGHSAITKTSSNLAPTYRPRPKTSDPRRIAPSPGLEPPRGAWASTTPSPLVRPVSAGPFPPIIQIERILADGTLAPSDPAIPLIAAIKTELNKCSLPGSTTNLVE